MTNSQSPPSTLRAWLELVRVPNLFTVPGDPVAGFLLASQPDAWADLTRVVPCAAAALFLYAAGLITNDLFDLREDLRDRPARPLPSGRVSVRAAKLAALALFALGLGAAAFAGLVAAYVACTLMGAIVLYNSVGKRRVVWGPINMGVCRGLALALGASAAGPEALRSPAVLIAAGGLALYIAAVTVVASREMSGAAPGWKALLPCAVLLLWLPAMSAIGPSAGTPRQAIAQALGVAAGIFVGTRGIDIRRQTHPVRIARGIGSFIRALLPAQASLAVAGAMPGLFVGGALLLLWPISAWAGRRFYSS